MILKMNIIYRKVYNGHDGIKCKCKTDTYEYFGSVRHGVYMVPNGILTTYTYNQKNKPSGKM